jgi:hypothetical protein
LSKSRNHVSQFFVTDKLKEAYNRREPVTKKSKKTKVKGS